MQFKEICELLVEIEAEFDVVETRIEGICIWPLIRQTLWFSLSQKDIAKPIKHAGTNKLSLYICKAFSLVSRLIRTVRYLNSKAFKNVEVAFFSRKVYLQSIEGATLYDRIVDPLIFLLEGESKVKKLYVGGVEKGKKLAYIGDDLFDYKHFLKKETPHDVRAVISKIAIFAGLEPTLFYEKVLNNYQLFSRWRRVGKKLFSAAPLLKTVYLTSWYFPDMMGLISAAKSHGIQVIDIQHGQQGRYQGMYSWWSKMPSGGYEMMPSKFWCWGQKSIDNITHSSHSNLRNMLFVGGYAWMWYYQSLVKQKLVEKKEKPINSKVILFTLQAPDGDHKEPIPNFVIDFLTSSLSSHVTLIIRCHPNYQGCSQYINERLNGVSQSKYIVSMGLTPLYDDLLIASHHLTACSTCCYEADAFGIPTMLFGQDALTIYQEEINNKSFMWTDGRQEDIVNWLALNLNELPKTNYIASSSNISKQALITHSLK